MFSRFEGSVVAWTGCEFRGKESFMILASWSMIGDHTRGSSTE